MAPLLLLLASLGQAQETFNPPVGGPLDPFDEEDESELFQLEEELVSVAARYDQTLRQAPSIVTLVTADQIRERGYVTLSDLLRDLPGIYVWRATEGRGLATFRGVLSDNNNKFLLLVDGVPWYDGVYSHGFIDDYLPLDHIKQVEVIQGPGSALYGTNAFSGVIQVVTMGPGDLDGVHAYVTGGGLERLEASVQGGAQRRMGGLETGVAAHVRFFGQHGPGLHTVPSGARNVLGADQRSGMNAGIRLQVEDLHLQLQHVDYRHPYLFDGSETAWELLGRDTDVNGLWYHNTFLHGRYDLDVGSNVQLRPHIWGQRHDNPGSYFFHQGFETVEHEDGSFETDHAITLVETEKDTVRVGGGVDAEARLGLDHHTVVGIGTENTIVLEVHDTAFDGLDPTPTHTGFGVQKQADEPLRRLCNAYGYLQHGWIVTPGVELTGGARLDQRFPCHPRDDRTAEVYRPHLSPRAGVLLIPNELLTVKLLHGWAFRHPNVREVLVHVSPDDDGLYPFAVGNYELAPESIRTSQAEVSVSPTDGLRLVAEGSHALLLNEIDKVHPPNRYENIDGHLQIWTGQAAVEAELGRLGMDLAYTFTTGRYEDRGPYANLPLYEFPPHMGKGRLRLQVTDRISSTLLSEVYGPRPRSAWSPDVGLPDGDPFALLHLGFRAVELGPEGRLELGASVRNLLDSEYDTGIYRDDANVFRGDKPRYPMPVLGRPRTMHVSLRIEI